MDCGHVGGGGKPPGAWSHPRHTWTQSSEGHWGGEGVGGSKEVQTHD